MSKPVSRRAKAAAETRSAILGAAKELYLECGSRGAPTKLLAERAGVAEGTVFVHFPDKASLLAAALHEDLADVLRRAGETMPAAGPCREKLLHVAGALYAYYAERPELSRALIKESLFLEGEWGRRVADAAMGFVGDVAGLVVRAIEEGEYQRETDASVFARAYFACYFGELVYALSAESFDERAALAALDRHIRLLERGVAREGR